MTLQVIRGGVIVQSVALAQHTATMHVGSAARAAADGVASLDGSGDVPLGQVPDTLTGKDADTLDGSHAGNAANKVPILDGSALLPLAQIPATLTGKDADTLDGSHAGNEANKIPILNGSGDLPLAQIPDTLTGKDADTLDGSHAGNEANKIPILDGSGDLPQTLFPGLLQKYVISDDLLHSHDGESYSASDAYVKVKTITINTLSPTPVTLRIKFDMRTNNSPLDAYGRIYKNGVAVGTERSRNATSYVTFSEDISFAQGDTLELWVHRSSTCWCYYRNFRVYGNDEWTLADAIENSNMGSAADAWDASNS